MHPGGGVELARWMLELEISWWGIDAGSGDHPMNTTIRHMRPDITRRFEEHVSMTAGEYFGDYEYTHHLKRPPGQRGPLPDALPSPSRAGASHAENVGGDLDKVLNTRCVIGAFPGSSRAARACPCRIIAFLDVPRPARRGGARRDQHRW